MTELHPSAYWCRQVEPDFWVITPHGWDQTNLEASWREEITFQEFLRRCKTSELIGNDLSKYF